MYSLSVCGWVFFSLYTHASVHTRWGKHKNFHKHTKSGVYLWKTGVGDLIVTSKTLCPDSGSVMAHAPHPTRSLYYRSSSSRCLTVSCSDLTKGSLLIRPLTHFRALLKSMNPSLDMTQKRWPSSGGRQARVCIRCRGLASHVSSHASNHRLRIYTVTLLYLGLWSLKFYTLQVVDKHLYKVRILNTQLFISVCSTTQLSRWSALYWEIMLFIGKPKGRSRMISNATNPVCIVFTRYNIVHRPLLHSFNGCGQQIPNTNFFER